MILKSGKEFDNSAELQKALDTQNRVVIGKGDYYTGPLRISRGVTLELEKGATLHFIPEFDRYRPVYTRWEGVTCYAMHPCLFLEGADGAVLCGEGTIDGSGEHWWKSVAEHKKGPQSPVSALEKELAALNPGYETQSGGGGGRATQFLRPPLLQIKDSDGVRVEGVTLTNSPFWTLHPVFSTNLSLENLKIINPYLAPNTDGIDIDSCCNVSVKNCYVQVGDDGICIKSGSGPDGIKVAKKSENISVIGCTVNRAHGGGVIGSETAAGIENISFEDCLFDHTDRGVRIKTRRGRGGAIRNLRFSNITMKENLAPFVINLYYRCGSLDDNAFSLDCLPVTDETPSVENVYLENCVSEDSLASAGMIVGLPESKVKNVVLKNCRFTVKKDASVPVRDTDMFLGLPDLESRGLRLRNAEVSISGLEITTPTGDALAVEDGVTFVD
jgi:Endopolygalacturonase